MVIYNDEPNIFISENERSSTVLDYATLKETNNIEVNNKEKQNTLRNLPPPIWVATYYPTVSAIGDQGYWVLDIRPSWLPLIYLHIHLHFHPQPPASQPHTRKLKPPQGERKGSSPGGGGSKLMCYRANWQAHWVCCGSPDSGTATWATWEPPTHLISSFHT